MSIKNKKETYPIEDGPCRELLFDALKYASCNDRDDNRRTTIKDYLISGIK